MEKDKDIVAEHLTKALGDIDSLILNLRSANRDGTNLESMIVLPMIEKAALLQQEINRLASARV